MRIPFIACALMLASTPSWSQGLAESPTAGQAPTHRGTATRILASSSHSGGHTLLKTAGLGFVAGAVIGAVVMTVGSGDGFFSDGEAAAMGLLGGGLAGGLIGIAVGAGIPAPSPASADRGPGRRPAPRRAGLGVALSVRF